MRMHLKSRTQAVHDKVDAAVSALSLADRSPFTTFLRSHQLAYRTVLSAIPQDHWMAGVLQDVIPLLERDLAALHAPVAHPALPAPPRLHPLGVAYVVCGSHFGKYVLKGRWSHSTDPAVLSAGAYLDSDALKFGWRQLMDAFASINKAAPLGHIICDDAERTFDLFHDCIDAVKAWEQTIAPQAAPKLRA